MAIDGMGWISVGGTVSLAGLLAILTETDPCGDDVEQLLSLYERERLLDSYAADVYFLAAVTYSILGREAMAVKYAL
jgi:hypothetical protein